MITLKRLQEIKRACKKVTTKLRAASKIGARFPSTKAGKIGKLLSEAGWCDDYKDTTRKIIEVAIGKKIRAVMNDKGIMGFYKKHALVVCTCNPNSHNYGTKPALCVAVKNPRYGCLRPSGFLGNNMPEAHIKGPVRYATDKEINSFFATIRDRVKAKKRVALK